MYARSHSQAISFVKTEALGVAGNLASLAFIRAIITRAQRLAAKLFISFVIKVDEFSFFHRIHIEVVPALRLYIVACFN